MAVKSFIVEIVTPSEIVISGEYERFFAPSTDGYFEVEFGCQGTTFRYNLIQNRVHVVFGDNVNVNAPALPAAIGTPITYTFKATITPAEGLLPQWVTV